MVYALRKRVEIVKKDTLVRSPFLAEYRPDLTYIVTIRNTQLIVICLRH